MTFKEDASILNRILKCEQAAVEAYERVLSGSAPHPQLWGLHDVAENHRQAVGRLRQLIDQIGWESTGETSCVFWQGLPRDRERKVFEDKELLAALRGGEAQEAEQCRWALRRESAYGPAREVLGGSIIPVIERNLEIIDGYLAPS